MGQPAGPVVGVADVADVPNGVASPDVALAVVAVCGWAKGCVNGVRGAEAAAVAPARGWAVNALAPLPHPNELLPVAVGGTLEPNEKPDVPVGNAEEEVANGFEPSPVAPLAKGVAAGAAIEVPDAVGAPKKFDEAPGAANGLAAAPVVAVCVAANGLAVPSPPAVDAVWPPKEPVAGVVVPNVE